MATPAPPGIDWQLLVDRLPCAVVAFDAADRLVVCNEEFRRLHGPLAGAIEPGLAFESLMRLSVEHGLAPEAVGREEAWVAERVAAHRAPAADGATTVRRLPDGRWRRVTETPLPGGGRLAFSVDVTELVQRQTDLAQLNARLEEARVRLEAISETDALTGIANRRHFDRRLREEWSRLQRHGTGFALLLADIDHFKRYNDRHGHQAGDQCLQRVANGLARCAQRPADLVARYGGEEFALLLPHADRNGAATQAMRVVAALDAAALPHGDSPVAPHVTLSVGGVVADPTRHGDEQALLAAADAALYRAKAEGRRRAVLD
jgi:diguanylate cyclase (GGDEF)-like protein